MKLREHIHSFREERKGYLDKIHSEEQAKVSLVLPFVRLLGYDTSNPDEVIPEYTADVGKKKGEKVDIAILQQGAPVILIECKAPGEPLDAHSSQLHRYFSVTRARVGVLTDGSLYNFYSDIEEPNKMDTHPFLQIDLFHGSDPELEQLQKFEKHSLDIDSLTEDAERLKHTSQIKEVLAKEIKDPSDEFVKLLGKAVYSGKFTSNTLERFREITQTALKEYLRDYVNSHFQQVMSRMEHEQGNGSQKVESEETEDETDADDLQRYHEEQEAFLIVKAIVRKTVDPQRLSLRTGSSYSSILMDNNIRRGICRLKFGKRKKRIEIPYDTPKTVEIESLDDIYQLEDDLRAYAAEVDGTQPNREVERESSG